MDKYRVEQLEGEAEVVLLKPRHECVSGLNGVVRRGEVFEEGVPEWGRDGAVGFDEVEFGGVQRGWVRW